MSQRRLSVDQVKAFHHEDFVADQVDDFASIMSDAATHGVVADIGGGAGYFAKAISTQKGLQARVIDMDPTSVAAARELGVEAVEGDALAPAPQGDEGVACFNLILHHLIGSNEKETRRLQIAAIRAWHGRTKAVFVNEYIYESFVPGFSGSMIFQITSNPILSGIARQIARFVPAFRANTFGVGVRFRSHQEWIRLFSEAGYRVVSSRIGADEPISRPLRSLLIKAIRRDSFRLEPLAG